LQWEADAFQDAFARTPMRFSHRFSGRPELTVDAVTDLSARVPPSWTRPHTGQLPVVYHQKVTTLETSGPEIARGIANNGGRILVYHIERLSSYAGVVGDCYQAATGAVGSEQGGVCAQSVSLLVASPDAVVQSHFDRHHNLLLQLEGTKEITVGTFADPEDGHRVVERARRWTHNNLSELPPRTQTFELGPGDGLYIPAYAFHWVRGSSDVSLALSYGFATQTTVRAPLVYWCNANLRRLGLRPRPPGHSDRADRVKAAVMGRAGPLLGRLPRAGR
jgi:mannose-6-phosphate isomerase-like protein (cupin superfamily)